MVLCTNGSLTLHRRTNLSKTAIEVKADLQAQGKSIPEWAEAHGFPVRAVRAVLYGHNKGYRGQAHKIAVDLGLKAKPE